MEFRKDSGIQGQWIPGTPSKPIPVNRPAPGMSGLNWAFDSGDVAKASGLPWSVPNHGQMAALAAASQGQSSALAFNNEGMAQVSSYRRLLAMNDPTIMNKMNLPHLGRIGDGVGSGDWRMHEMNNESLNRNKLVLNGRFLFPPNHENGSGRLMLPMAPTPRHMSEFPFLNLNSFPENNMGNTIVSRAMPPPATPATLEKNQNHSQNQGQSQNQRKRLQGCLPCEIIDLDPEPLIYQGLMHNGSSQLPQALAENPEEQCFSNQVESSQIVNSQHQEGERNVAINSPEGGLVEQAEGENQGIDLNKTPPHKPKRKKHRPKVIREGKPARTPKPSTPKPPKTTETPSGKRKYVRKKKDVSPLETHTNPQDNPLNVGLGEIVDQESRSRSKPVRRSLNFDLEASQVVDRLSRSASMSTRQNAFEGQRPEAHHATVENVASRNSLSDHCSQGQGPVALESLTGCGVGFGLSHSTIPQTPNRPSQPSRLEMLKIKWRLDFERMLNNMSDSPHSGATEGGNMKRLARMTSYQNNLGNLDRHLEDRQRQVASYTNREELLRGEKRGHSLVDNAQVSVNGNYNESNAATSFHDIHKRRRIENDHKEPIPSASSISASPPTHWKTIHNMRNTSKVLTFADAERSMFLERSQSNRMSDSSYQDLRGANDGRIQDHRLTSTPTKLPVQNNIDCMPPQTPAKAGYRNGQETEIYGPEARVEMLITKQKKAKPRSQKRKELDPPGYFMASNANETRNAASHIGCSPTTESEPQLSRMMTAQHGDSPGNYRHNRSNYQTIACRGLQSGALVSYRDPIEEIVRKLRHLDINGGHEDIAFQPQNALVPYVGGDGTMVPFHGPFELVKKRKPRPKVDLDPESHRVWKLLMGKEVNEEGTAVDKEKWWEEERRVFRGRADSFIARMHLIQGDRRFSRWKGSVVDSVIGVFLTQNVSDHLSSSAFMALSARFPPQSIGKSKADKLETISKSMVINDTSRWQGEILDTEFCGQSSPGFNEFEQSDNKETVNSNSLPESNSGGGIIDYSKDSSSEFHEIELGTSQGSPDSTLGTAGTLTSCTSEVEGDDRKSLEDVVSSQNSIASSQNSSECPGQTNYQSQPSSLLNFEADELLDGGKINSFTSFRELLEMVDERALNDLKANGNGRILSAEHHGMIDWAAALRIDKSSSIENGPAFYSSNSHLHSAQHGFSSLSRAPSSSHRHRSISPTRFVGREKANIVINESSQSLLPEVNETTINETVGRLYGSCTGSSTNAMDQNEPLNSKIPLTDLLGPIDSNTDQPISSWMEVRPLQDERHSCCQNEASSKKNVSSMCLNQKDDNAVTFPQMDKDAELQTERTWKAVGNQTEIHDRGNQMNEKIAEGRAEANLRNETSTSEKVSAGTSNSPSKGKKAKAETEKKTFDWDSLRRHVVQNDAKKERSSDAMDSLDYEALRNADVSEISNAIRERGMNNMLAERIKDFLNRLVRDHGSMDLEWLRDIPPDKAKDYLLSIWGLGLKSVECIRLLTLHHLAFPVDTNVGRICVRLGWVPLQPLPESLQLHLLEMYPMLETIQKYLWPRLCTLDQRTLYELHYQLITFGKVFCTKSKPNCNACPMRGECKHFASAFASARLALPGPEEKHLVPSEVPFSSDMSHSPASIPVPLPQIEGGTLSKEQIVPRNCEPIIEEPATPEPECIETSEIDIEDAFYNDPDEIPTIKLNFEEFTQNLQNYMQENNLGLQDGDMSKALVAISPDAASIPMPKLKNVSRLRTEHQVYELPDTHPLLEGLDKRETDDPCPYLLAIWTPGETSQSTEPPTAGCNSQDMGKLCDKNTCFSCNSIREAQSQMVRGTILIPCRTANRGSFPLNGTYFQVNEVFADHDSSRNPIDVPREWIWNLPRRTVYFGTSTPSIFKGLTTEEIQHCFWRGFVCVRGFDRAVRAPRPLFARLHFPASKSTRNRRAAETAAREEVAEPNKIIQP